MRKDTSLKVSDGSWTVNEGKIKLPLPFGTLVDIRYRLKASDFDHNTGKGITRHNVRYNTAEYVVGGGGYIFVLAAEVGDTYASDFLFDPEEDDLDLAEITHYRLHGEETNEEN